ncbi:Fucose-1-phosphate guanylyltransferase [Armadillidium nasatum]|uniref:Fucose-1-phosphate guanylyltransferase n=1 Tax=Armadillidium nasatum TaxID=96803 RepID=A0A5N5T6P4_9CRUS|nr:Fucose-1-phosphate guanylyltransferase [Armadillidium nasatum]
MTKLFQAYKNIQLSKNENEIKFWDLVILTTYDQEQKKCFEKQIQELMSHVSLLKKLGCGGSTLHVIKTLEEVLNISLYNKRILIIHSDTVFEYFCLTGGSSQRLPSYSVQGKIFSPVPVKDLISGSRVSHMLDLKLAMYLPFCNLLRPGIFVTCGDDIETFYLDANKVDVDKLQKADVVALAHPCDIETAVGHGVYVTPEKIDTLKESSVIVSDCSEVLQKPSIELMRSKNATFIENNEEKVYSDSVFWMSEKVYRSLLSWYKNATIDAELDAYGHFLPCFGVNVKSSQQRIDYDYITQLLPVLKDFDLKLIILRMSQFYHLGTMKEYLFNFTNCPSFMEELSLVKNTSNVSSPCLCENNEQERSLVISCFLLKDRLLTLKTKESQLIAEWSEIETPLCVKEKLILSNCVIKLCQEIEFLQNEVDCFGSFLYHTIPLRLKEILFYVTIAYETTANLKSSFTDFASVEFAAVPIKEVLFLGDIKEAEAAADGKPFSLWNLRLFKGALTPEESFWKTHNFINKILNWKDKSLPMQTKLNLNDTCPIFSMKQIMKLKDLDVFLNNRKKLIELIDSSHKTES